MVWRNRGFLLLGGFGDLLKACEEDFKTPGGPFLAKRRHS